nr:PREDICTED: uncharacterized protein LOC105663290 [Megachile rotundata]
MLFNNSRLNMGRSTVHRNDIPNNIARFECPFLRDRLLTYFTGASDITCWVAFLISFVDQTSGNWIQSTIDVVLLIKLLDLFLKAFNLLLNERVKGKIHVVRVLSCKIERFKERCAK